MLQGRFNTESIRSFLRSVQYRQGSSNPIVVNKLPRINSIQPWNGKDPEPEASFDDDDPWNDEL